FDPNKSKTIFSDLGWKPNANGVLEKEGKTFSFTLETFDFAKERQQASVAAQTYWKNIGVDVKTQWVETTVLLSRLNKGQFQAAWIHIPGFIDPDGTLRRFECSSIDAGNVTRYCNPELDKLVDQAGRSLNQSERKQSYQKVLDILAQDQPALWVA